MLIILNYFQLKDSIKEYGFNDKQAQHVISRLRKMDKQIKKSFGIWYTKKIYPEYSIENFTVEELVTEAKMNPFNAFLTFDWLKKEPEVAKKSLIRLKNKVVSNTGEDKLAEKCKSIVNQQPEEEAKDLEIDTDSEE